MTYPDFVPAIPEVTTIHIHNPYSHNTVCGMRETPPTLATTDPDNANCTMCLSAWFGIRGGENNG